MLRLNARLTLYVLSLAMAGFGLFSLYDGLRDANPNQVLALSMFAGVPPLVLIISAIRSILREVAVKEISTGTDYAGTAVIHKYLVTEVRGSEARSLGIRRLVFPVLIMIVLGVVIALKSDWSEPLRW